MLTITETQTRTDFEALRFQLSACQCCPLHERRAKIVHVRGTLPAPVLFLGEAPGRTEDSLGYPFTGDCGKKILNPILKEVWQVLRWRKLPTYAISNIVACVPLKEDFTPNATNDNEEPFQYQEKLSLRPPTKDEASACAPRLLRTIEICDPAVVVLLGKVAFRDYRHLAKQNNLMFPTLELWHPAYILRRGGLGTMEHHKTVLDLTAFLTSHKKELQQWQRKSPNPSPEKPPRSRQQRK